MTEAGEIFKTNMKKILERMRKASASDQADAGIITSLFLLPVVFFLLISVIDVGLYFMNEATITKAARDGATTATTLGGVGDRDYYAPAESNYPQRVSKSELQSKTSSYGFPVRNSIEYFVAQDLVESASTYEVELAGVECYTRNSSISISKLGQNAVCEVKWRYNGLPLSGWGMVQSRDNSGEIIPKITTGFSSSDLLVEGRESVRRG